MPEEMGGTAVLETADTSVNADISSVEPNSSTDATNTDDVSRGTQDQDGKQDGRRQPDALKKHIADLRRRADSITDPVEKKAELDRIKFLYDTSGKARGYEEVYPTVREAREVKALIESMGGRDGLTQMQSVLTNAQRIDAGLASGDPTIAKEMWDEAPDGMQKLMPVLLDRFAQEKPQEYEKFITPKAVGLLDQSGFTRAFDRMVQAYEGGKLEDAKAIRDELIKWVTGNRQQVQQEPKTNPEVERLQRELNERNQKDEAAKVDTAYNAAVTYAGPAIDKVAKPLLAKFGLTGEEYAAFRAQVWSHLQDTRNNNETYKTVAPAKVRQGYDKWTEYANRWTDENAEHSIRAVLKMPPWTRLQPSTKTPTATQSPVVPNVQKGKEPTPAEIDYGPKGKQAAQKAGFKSLEDMILSGQAPLKAGGIRKWR